MNSYNFGKVLFSGIETKNLTITANGIIEFLKNKGNKTFKDETKQVIYDQWIDTDTAGHRKGRGNVLMNEDEYKLSQ